VALEGAVGDVVPTLYVLADLRAERVVLDELPFSHRDPRAIYR